ncbi:MAG TPA: Rieske 2Fe-2S domain-containing protein [Vicinamibacteria bacterium]|nr:Rieske 2Fe-2S domain-containing protein [Vicinamibacteria bacterium]
MEEPGFVRAIAVGDLVPGACMEVAVDGKALALCNVDGRFYALGNSCLHRGGPLGQGMLEGTVVMCPWHAWSWDVTTGENTANATLKMPCYEVKVQDGQVFVKVI